MKLKEIAENHGLTPEGVDYALTQYQIVICEITHGMLSKLSYDAKTIIRTAQERWCDTCDLKEQEPVIVLCKNCRHYNTACCEDGYGWCERRDFGTNDEWYCTDGEVETYAADF